MERTHTRLDGSRAPLAASAIRRVLLASSILAGSIGGMAQAGTLPVGGAVAQGTASISTNAAGTTTTITQTSARAVINWTSFSVSQGNSVVFTQPTAASATLNRVTGTTASSIAGQISSNGAVYLVNPNGIAITSTGTVNTAGGFVASTLALSDANFMAGTLSFTGNGSSATVSNAGSIIASSGAYVALLGGQVANTGTITVPLGQVGLGSGEQVALNLNGGNFLQLAVPTSALSGSNALVSNSGAITASGGTVTLSAATLASLVRNVVNMSGSISADSATGTGGTIMLTGGAGGTVTVSGSLSARATGATGNGGLVETSGAHTKLAGIAVTTTAAHGTKGKWVIDPTDFTIAAAGGDITGAALSANLANTNVSIFSSGGNSGSNGDINVNDAVSWSSGSSLTLDAYHSVHFNAAVSVGGAGGVVIKTNDGGTGGDYDFGLGGGGFAGSLSFTGGKGSGASLTVNGAAYTLLWQASDLQALNASSAALVGNYALAGNIDASTLVGFVPIGTTSTGGGLNGGNGFAGSFTGLGHTVTNLNLSGLSAQSNVGLFGISSGTVRDIGVAGGQVAGSSNVGALVGSMHSGAVTDAWSSASVTSSAASGLSIGGLVGLQMGGAISNSSASGTVSGMCSTSADIGGLVGQQTAGSIANVSVSGAVSGNKGVGGVIGAGQGTLTNAIASGSATVTGSGATSVGGLVGYDGGMTITNSSASGAVSALSAGSVGVGGLVGSASGGVLTNTFATGSVTAGDNSSFVGGLVGKDLSGPTIANSYATGNVSTGASASMVGGLVGLQNASSITGSYALGNVATGSGSVRVGGLVGFDVSSTMTTAYALGKVSGGSGSSYVGGLVGDLSGGSISGTYASGGVSGSKYLGGLVGVIDSGGTLSSSYWDTQTTGQAAAAGSGAVASATGLTTAQARNAASYVGWDFTNVWYQVGDMRPIMRAEAAATVGGVTTVANLDQLVLAAAVPSGTILLGANIDATITNGANASGIWGVGGFVPLGTDGAGKVLNGGNGFNGSLNGLGHTITNLTISRAGVSDVGLFGYAGAGAVISNVSLVNATVSGGSSTGALVGYDNGGTISVTSASGSVKAGAGAAGVGGLVGLLAGNGAITTTFATDAVSAGATATGIGGLVGSITSGSVSVTQASGAVAGGAGSSAIGGLVGSASGDTIANTYAMGAVSGGANVGGLVGTNAGSIGQSYAAGAVSGTSGLGGLVGSEAAGGTITSSVWNTQTTGRSAGTGSGSATGATGLTTAQMQDFTAYTTTYAGWDFTNVWAPPTQVGQADQTAAYYPQLYALTPVVVANPGNASRSYGTAAVAVSGTVLAGGAGAYAFGAAGDSLSGASLATSTTPANANVGTYAVLGAAGSVVTSAKGVVYREIVPQNGVLTITPASLTITYTASSASRIYGAANPALNGTVSASGLVGSDTLANVLSGTASWSTSAGTTSGVGGYAITGSGLSSASSNNYAITAVQAAGNANALSITPRALTLTPNAVSAYYGSGAPATDTASATGLVNGDAVASVAVTSPATVTSSVGTYSLSGSNAVFASGSAGNYAISYASNATGLTVKAEPVTVSYNATPVSQAYGQGTPWVTGSVSVTGLVNGDTLWKIATGSVSWINGVNNFSNVGTYAITGSGLSAVANPNYAISIVQAAGNASAITVTPAAAIITYSAYGAERSYGVANGAYSGVISENGLVNGDTVAGVTTGTPIYTSAANTTTSVGKYAILGSGLVANDANYAITFAQALNNPTDLTIIPRVLTLTANAMSRTYGAANPTTDTVTILPADATTGLVNGDMVAGETVSSNAAPGAGVGSYALYGSNAVFSSGSASNYTVNYVSNQWGLTVNPAPLTLTYTATATSRFYGAANPTYTGSVTASGLVNGDSLASATLGGISWTTTATSGSGVGAYTITGSGLVAQFSNYTITSAQAASNATALTINPAAVTITYTAAPVTRIYGTANPGFSGSLSANGLVNGDTLTGITSGTAVFGTTATLATGVGTYAINGSGLAANSANYSFSFAQSPGNASALSIAPRALTLTPSAMSLAQGSAIPASDAATAVAATATTGLVNGDTVSGVAVTSDATSASGLGGYALYGANAVFSAGSAGNYTINYGVNQWGLTIH